MTSARAGHHTGLDIQDFIDSHPLSPMQWLLLVQCFAVVAIDGFDTGSIGFIAPAIRSTWALRASQLAPLFGSGLFGLTVGAFLVGPFSDRRGRKTGLLWSMILFGLASLASAFSPSLTVLIAFRFLTGLGLGGALPNAITLASEYCPARRRSTLVTLILCGFTLGSALGGVVSAQMLAGPGWRSVLMLGGILPLLLAPMLAWTLPESIRFLALSGRDPFQVRRTLQRIHADADLRAAVPISSASAATSPVTELFRKELLGGTLLLWLASFMSLLVVYLLSSWLPTILHTAGATLQRASLITAMFQVGGTVGALTLGRFMDKINPQYVLATTYAVAAPFVALIGFGATHPWLLVLAIFGAGYFVSGSQSGANALAAAFYPTVNRATGVSWATGVGRIGSILGSMIGGSLFAMGWGLPAVFLLVAIPPLIAAAAFVVLAKVRRATGVLSAATLETPDVLPLH